MHRSNIQYPSGAPGPPPIESTENAKDREEKINFEPFCGNVTS